MVFNILSLKIHSFFAALRTTRGSLFVSLSVRLSVRLSVHLSVLAFLFFAIYSENLQATNTSKFVTLCNIFLRMPYAKKIVYEGVQHFLDTKYKTIFLL